MHKNAGFELGFVCVCGFPDFSLREGSVESKGKKGILVPMCVEEKLGRRRVMVQ